MALYWIDIETPKGTLSCWTMYAPLEQFKIAKSLGYRVAYGKEGDKKSRSHPANYEGTN